MLVRIACSRSCTAARPCHRLFPRSLLLPPRVSPHCIAAPRSRIGRYATPSPPLGVGSVTKSDSPTGAEKLVPYSAPPMLPSPNVIGASHAPPLSKSAFGWRGRPLPSLGSTLLAPLLLLVWHHFLLLLLQHLLLLHIP